MWSPNSDFLSRLVLGTNQYNHVVPIQQLLEIYNRFRNFPVHDHEAEFVVLPVYIYIYIQQISHSGETG